MRQIVSTDGRSRRASRALTRCMKSADARAWPWIELLSEIAEDFEAEGKTGRATRIRRRLRRDLARLPASAERTVLRMRAARWAQREAIVVDIEDRALDARQRALVEGWRAAVAWERGDAQAVAAMERAFYALGAQAAPEGAALRHHEDLAWQADRICQWSEMLGRDADALRWRRVALAFLTQAEPRPRLHPRLAHHELALGRMLLAEERYAEAAETLRAARAHTEAANAELDALLAQAERHAEERRREAGLR